MRMHRRHRRRRARDVDRGGIHHRQGDARPPDVRAGAGLPGLRLREPQGLCGPGTSRGARPAWSVRVSPQLLCARGRSAGKALPASGPAGPVLARTAGHVRHTRVRLTASAGSCLASATSALYQPSGTDAAGCRNFGRLMRFTSLIVELIRARPRLVVWLVVLMQAAMWLVVAMLLYRSPP